MPDGKFWAPAGKRGPSPLFQACFEASEIRDGHTFPHFLSRKLISVRNFLRFFRTPKNAKEFLRSINFLLPKIFPRLRGL